MKVTDSPVHSGRIEQSHKQVAKISAKVSKGSLFSNSPTIEDVNFKLQEEAARIGANAVIDVTYSRCKLLWYEVLEAQGLAVVASPLQYHLADVDSDYVEGWAFSPRGLDSIEIRVDGNPVGTTPPTLLRPDVEAAVPGATGPTGFRLKSPPGSSRSQRPAVSVIFKQKRGADFASEAIVIPNLNGSARASAADNKGTLSPLPLPVHRILCPLRGEEAYNIPWTDEVVKQAVEDLAFIVQRGPRHLPDLYHYLGFLKLIWAKFDFILHHFPKFNESTTSDKDSIAIASSIPEMFSIAHSLYVLKTRGVQGHFAEFCCFKGFRTSMLSEACFQLGIPVDVFDSFAGLPPSESHYYQTGEFMGSLPEVQRNVSTFGKMEAVTFHPGFFADTLPKSDLQPMCIWMDVDLESSSRDIMTILGRLPVESCLFSHECCPEYFGPTGIVAARGPDSVVGPILDAFRENGREITGRFIFRKTGAFWDRNRGIPVIPVSELIRIKDLGRSQTYLGVVSPAGRNEHSLILEARLAGSTCVP